MSSKEHRYYKRVIQSGHTRCWGVLLAFGLQLPATPPPAPPAAPSAPPPVARPAATAPYGHRWTLPIAPTSELLLALSAGFVFTAGDDEPLEARTIATGQVAWTHAIASWQALATTDTLVLGVSGGHVYALDAAKGQTRWVTETTGPNTRLFVAGERLLVVSDEDILLRDITSGKPLWRAGLTAPPSAPAVVGDASVVIALSNKSVVSFDVVTGAPQWSSSLDLAPTTLSAAAPFVYVGLSNGTLCWLRDRDGRRDRCYPLRVPIVGPPIIDDQFVYVVQLDNVLRAFDRRNGAMRRQDSLRHRPSAGPWLTSRGIIVTLTTGEFVVVDHRAGRIVARLSPPGTNAMLLLERAAVSADGRALASLTIAPGGERQLSVYLPVLTFDNLRLPRSTLLPAPRTTLLAPPSGATSTVPTAPATPGPAPRPFPAAR